MKNNFIIGAIVTLKSHPLLYNKVINGDGKLVPPFMVIKEIFNDDKKKRTHSEELGKEIADKIKYNCVFFDDNRVEFKEVFLYKSSLSLYKKLEEKDKEEKKEVINYLEKYKFGSVVSFKTKNIELSKLKESKRIDKRENLKPKEKEDPIKESELITIQNVVNYSSPNFVLIGIKKNDSKNEFYPNGDIRKVASEILYKVKWFNSNQMKFSEIYLPAECFTDVQPFKTKVPHNLVKKDI
ncbi:hypothetical protein K8354_06090 [Polaribacter litorisediminis]|uniref:hypothetical protein n=1 Tax=Polaribacter litorisediminis TaxID=1908341 RepID=UPI001CBAFA11|nr:hypothetical protein [Polaribacter litorisediminis]UAM99381.1 hypothetical protein K8354_06090 [Polaribacter litorisediminis]